MRNPLRTDLMALCLLFVGAPATAAADMSAWLMPKADEEVALALSAAPENIAAGAGIYTLRAEGYQPVRKSSNGFNCLVERAFGNAETARVRAPICYDAEASRTVMQMKMVVAKSAMSGAERAEVQQAAHAAFASGKVRAPTHTAFAYMFSADQYLGAQVGAYLPHMMIYAPYYDNGMLGGNTPGGSLPALIEKPGTAFSTAVIPVDPALAIKAK